MPDQRSIKGGDVVSLRYTLETTAGELLETSEDDDAPTLYMHGAGNLLPGLEERLVGRAAGERLEGVIPCEEAFGERDEEGEQTVPRSELPEGMQLEVGEEFEVEGPEGEPVLVWVRRVDEDAVVFDTNHPLSGFDLQYAVEVLSIRDATPEEVEHGHPHGESGHEDH